MGIISSIFGERPSAPQTGGFTVGAEIPKELAPYYKDILGKSQALYNDSVSQGYKPYTGPSLAEFTPEQQQAFTGIAGLQGQQAPVYQEAMGMTREAATPITTEEITEYMNPYQQAVVDIEKREATKQYQSQVVPQLAAKAAMTQPFGGSRQAILEGMAADTQQRLLGDIQAKGSAQAYQDSVNLLNQQRAQQGNAAGQLATLGSNQFKSQLGELGALQTIGEEKQQLSQQALNEAYGQYIKEQEYPFQQLGRYQSVVTGAPIQQSQYVPPTPPGPSVGQQLLGGAATMLGTYGAFGGQMPQLFGGNTPAKTGGGIGDLPVIKRQQPGPANRYNYYDALPVDYETPKYTDDIRIMEAIENAKLKKYNYEENLRKRKADLYGQMDRQPAVKNVSQDDYNRYIATQNINDPLKGTSPNVLPEVPINEYEGLPKNKVFTRDKTVSNDIEDIEDTGGLLSIVKNKYNNFLKKRKDINTTINEGNRIAAEEEALNPFNDKNKPSMFADKTDVRPDSPAKQDLKKAVDYGSTVVGNSVDLLNKGNNWINKNMNRLLKIGETYVLKPGDDSGITELPIRTNEEAREIYNKYNIGGKDIPTSKEEQKRISKEVNTVDRRSGYNEGLIVEAERILEDPSSITNSNAVDKIKSLYIQMADGLNTEATEKKTKNLLEKPLPPKQLENVLEKPIKTIDNINNNKRSNNIKINNNESKALTAQVDYGNLVTNKEEGDKVPKSKLKGAQDTYLAAVKNMNDGLKKKDALIGKAQQESFWAFVARVGANISKGGGISESVAAELPKAMKDRQSLIQAKSDLADKKLAGKVDVAKVGLDVEKSRTSAKIATEKEAQRRKEVGNKQFIDWIGAVNKSKGKTIPYKLSSKSSLDLHGPMVTDTISKALEFGDTRFTAPTILNDEGVAYTGKDLASNIKKIAKQDDFRSAVLSTFEQISGQYAEDGIVKDMDELMVEATNKVMNNLPTKYKNKSSSFWSSF